VGSVIRALWGPGWTRLFSSVLGQPRFWAWGRSSRDDAHPRYKAVAVRRLLPELPFSAPSPSARNDVNRRDEGNDDHRSDRNDGDGGRGKNHARFLASFMARETSLQRLARSLVARLGQTTAASSAQPFRSVASSPTSANGSDLREREPFIH